MLSMVSTAGGRVAKICNGFFSGQSLPPNPNPSLRKLGQYIPRGGAIAIVHVRGGEDKECDCGAGEMICVEYKEYTLEHTLQKLFN